MFKKRSFKKKRFSKGYAKKRSNNNRRKKIPKYGASRGGIRL